MGLVSQDLGVPGAPLTHRGVASEFSGKTKNWKGSCVFLLRIPSIDEFLGL